MDNKGILLHSRFATALRRAGQALDILRFVNENDYAGAILAEALRSPDGEVLQLALQIGQLRGLMPGGTRPSTPTVATRGDAAKTPSLRPRPDDDDEPPPTRYVRSLR